MIRFILILIIVLVNASLFAQEPAILWAKTFGGSDPDYGNSVQQTKDGGYIIAGGTESFGAGARDIWLIKTDANGDTLWTKTFGGNDNDEGYSIDTTSDGGYIIVGSTRSFGAGVDDVWLIKTDASGNTLWTKTYGGNDNDEGNSIYTTSDGGYIIVGSTRSFGAGLDDVWLIKTDANGDTLWTKTFGDSLGDWGNSVQQTSDGGYIIAGVTIFWGFRYPELPQGSWWLIKTDANGDTMWTKTLAHSDILDEALSVRQTIDGGYIITGAINFDYYHGGGDLWLIKTDANGDTMWTKTFENATGHSVKQTSDHGYIIAVQPWSGANVWLIKTDASGNTLWTKTYGGNGYELGWSVMQTNDDSYIIIGDFEGSPINYDVLLIKLAPDITAIEEMPQTAVYNYQLRQNYPNPFNPTTNIEFSIPKSEFVTLNVYNILGEEVATLVSDRLTAGRYNYDWDASSLASGVYLYRIQAGNYIDSKKMVLLR